MKFESFRDLLVRKADGNPNLQSFIKYVRDDIIADYALETLEKMARSSHKGDTANFAVRDFATEMDPEMEPHMIRDALGHHVSHYKAAIGAGKQDLANQHAKQAFKIMNLADRVQKHSNGKLAFEHISPHAWERNKFTEQYAADHPKVKEGKYKPGDFTIKTKGLNYKGNDFAHLQQPSHSSYEKETKKHGHTGAYPFENMRINGKYVHVDDNVDSSGYQPHPFDYHPILQHFDDPAHKRLPEADQRYIAARDNYANSEHINSYFNKHQELEQADPEGYSKRGSQISAPVHAGAAPIAAKEGEQSPVAPQQAQPKAEPAAQNQPLDLSSLPPHILAEIEKWQKEKGKK